MLKLILILLGTFSLVFGLVGIFVPGLPTTPFLLLTAALYLRSSDRLYRAMIRHKVLGNYITSFREAGGMSRRAKIGSIILMWLMIALTSGVLHDHIPTVLFLILAGLTGSLVMGYIIPTRK